MITPELQEQVNQALDFLMKTNDREKSLEEARARITAFQKDAPLPIQEVFDHFDAIRRYEIAGPSREDRLWLFKNIKHARSLGHVDIKLPYRKDGEVDYAALKDELAQKIDRTMQAYALLDLIDQDPDVNAAFKDDPRLEGFRSWLSLEGEKPKIVKANEGLYNKMAYAIGMMNDEVREQRLKERKEAESLAAQAEAEMAEKEKTDALFAPEPEPEGKKGLSRMAFWKKTPAWKPPEPLKKVETVKDAVAYLFDTQSKSIGLRKSGVIPNIDEALFFFGQNPDIKLENSNGQLVDAPSSVKTLKLLDRYHVTDVGFAAQQIERNTIEVDIDRFQKRCAAQFVNLRTSLKLLQNAHNDPVEGIKIVNDPHLDEIAKAYAGTDIGEAARRIVKLRPLASGPTAGPTAGPGPTPGAGTGPAATGPTAGPTSGTGPASGPTPTAGPATSGPSAHSSSGASGAPDPAAQSSSIFADIYKELDRKAQKHALRKTDFLSASMEMVAGAWGKVRGLIPSRRNPKQPTPGGPSPTGTS